MDKNIKIHIKDRVAVAEGDPVIICGNKDYTVTFTFDEEWGQAFAKTARFNFRTFDGPNHIDQPFTGDTVKVPELSNVCEVEVGVFVGDLNTTTGAPIRCKPCIRCGSGAPKDPTPDVYDEIMELINKGGGGSGGGGTLDGLPVYVVEALPDDPEVGGIVALNKAVVKPWDKVKVWSRAEVTYREEGAVAMCEALPFEGSFVAGAVPETPDLSGVDTNNYFVSSVLLQGRNGAIDISIDNIRGTDGDDIFVVIYDHYKNVRYVFNSGVWQAHQGESEAVDISAQDIKLPNISDVVALDYFCTMTDDEFMEYESFATVDPRIAMSMLSQLGAITHEAGLYIVEETNGGHIWQKTDKKTAKQLLSIKAQTAEAARNASTALTRADNALRQAVNAQSAVESYNSKFNELKAEMQNCNEMANAASRIAANLQIEVNTMGPKVDRVIETAETNKNAIVKLQEAVNGYSTFLEEINGEVVADE